MLYTSIHPLYTFITIFTPMYTRCTCIYTTPLNTPHTHHTHTHTPHSAADRPPSTHLLPRSAAAANSAANGPRSMYATSDPATALTARPLVSSDGSGPPSAAMAGNEPKR